MCYRIVLCTGLIELSAVAKHLSVITEGRSIALFYRLSDVGQGYGTLRALDSHPFPLKRIIVHLQSKSAFQSFFHKVYYFAILHVTDIYI